MSPPVPRSPDASPDGGGQTTHLPRTAGCTPRQTHAPQPLHPAIPGHEGPIGRAERTRRRLARAARGPAHAADTCEWADHTRAADDAGLVTLATLMRPIADRSGLEAVQDEVAPDGVCVAEERRFWETEETS